MNDAEKMRELSDRLEQLIRQHSAFQEQIQRISRELNELKTSSDMVPVTQERIPDPPPVQRPPVSFPATPAPSVGKPRRRWEEFIGTNLLNKIGIAVLVLGVAFGAKYSIDHNLINPLTRIILGYIAGIILIAIAFRLREKHAAFSAVLLSGGMAVLYFITYVAYSMYDLIPQVPAFILMVIFTAFTVFAAVRYNYEVIGIIGLVGAYAVPVLLSDGSGRVVILFSYIAIINAGILLLAFRKYWKRLQYTAFALTWMTFSSWFSFLFYVDKSVGVALSFSTLYLLMFYLMFLANKLLRSEALGRWDVVCMLLNSFIYFSFGYLAVSELPNGERYLGLFTVATALLHFVAVVIIYKTRRTSSDVFYFVAGMVLTFLTIAVPVQLEGNWVTLVWAAEAALLFWIGRTKGFHAYEKLSYPLVVLALFSLVHDWDSTYPSFFYDAEPGAEYPVLLNVQFLTSMIVGVAYLVITWLWRRFPLSGLTGRSVFIDRFGSVAMPVLGVVIIYLGFYKEIEAFWNFKYAASRLTLTTSDGFEYYEYDASALNFKVAWLLMFSALFGYGLYFMHTKFGTRLSYIACLAFNAVVLMAFITAGLVQLSELRSAYVNQELDEYFSRGIGHILVRYASVLLMLPLLWLNRRLVVANATGNAVRRIETLFFHLVVLALLSSELIHWFDLAEVENSFKLSLSILWGAYALFMIVYGLSRDAKHIRLGGMVLFAVTLIKLFAYDMEDMSTILKTVVMIVLGALLLIASFIYNKYKGSTRDETQ